MFLAFLSISSEGRTSRFSIFRSATSLCSHTAIFQYVPRFVHQCLAYSSSCTLPFQVPYEIFIWQQHYICLTVTNPVVAFFNFNRYFCFLLYRSFSNSRRQQAVVKLTECGVSWFTATCYICVFTLDISDFSTQALLCTLLSVATDTLQILSFVSTLQIEHQTVVVLCP